MKRQIILVMLTAVCLCGFAETRKVVGTFGDKSVKAYQKKIPQQAEGYYLKVTPTEIVVAGRDASGTFYGEQALEKIKNGKCGMISCNAVLRVVFPCSLCN